MSILKFLITTLLVMGYQYSTSAAIIAKNNVQNWSSTKPTRIILASKGLSFASVGYLQAKVYQNLYPDDQILFITNMPDKNSAYRNTKQSELKKMGFIIQEESDKKLNTRQFIDIVKANSERIRSIDVIGHNGVDKGPWLEDGDNRLDYQNEGIMRELTSRFLPNAWVRLHGCNSGWNVARFLSRYWQIPAIGTFTSTSFYYLTNSGNYELFQSIEGGAASPGITPAKFDTKTFLDQNGQAIKTSCPSGGCMTLIPEGSPYHYHVHNDPNAAWLPMAKPVCNSIVSEEQCLKAQAESLITAVGATPRATMATQQEAYEEALFGSVCGSYAKAVNQESCKMYVKKAYLGRQNYFPYKLGKMLKCDGLRVCKFQQVSIDLRKNAPENTDNTILEYLDNGLKGFYLLQNSQ